jgi:hypothetical protein
MKRDMDLVRTILFEIEEHQNPNSQITLKAPGASPDQVAYHVKMLAQAGLIEAKHMTGFGDVIGEWIPVSLTWKGHEFLEAARNEGIWQKAKAQLKDRAMTLPFSLITDLLTKLAAEQMGLR